MLDEHADVKLFLETLNDARQKLLPACRALVKLQSVAPSPSQYAQLKNWAHWQAKPTAILCLRPTEKQGLPLSLLHPVFSAFTHQVTNPPLPDDEDTVAAESAAFLLCQKMGDVFNTEYDRQEVFSACVDGLLGEWQHHHRIRSVEEGRSARVDGYLRVGDSATLRVDKLEPGEAGDPYMQIARSYQILVAHGKEQGWITYKHGTPTFLLCVLGT